MLFNHCGKLTVDCLHDLKAAGAAQRLGKSGFKGLPLFCGRHGQIGMEYCVDKLLMQFSLFAGVEQRIVDVGAAVIKGREQEAQLRRSDSLTGGTMKLVISGEVAQFRFSRFNRADRTQNIGKDLIRFLISHGVVISTGYIVAVACQQQQIIALAHVQRLNDFLIKCLPHPSILRTGCAQFHQHSVFFPRHDLLGGKHNIDQVFSECS